jgi:Holliday junction resolvase RusA-like endonuclease
MPTSRLIVPGEPTGKGRPRFTRAGGVYTPAKTETAEKDIATLWRSRRRPTAPAGEPFAVRITARYSRPDSHYRAGGDLKDWALTAVPGTPGNRKQQAAKDLDNIVKLVLDSLNGVAWDDDVWCTGIMATKEWTPEHQREGELDIEVWW